MATFTSEFAKKYTRYEIAQAVNIALASMNAGYEAPRFSLKSLYKFERGAVVVGDAGDAELDDEAGETTIYVFRLSNGAYVAMWNAYGDEEDMMHTGSDGNEYIHDGCMNFKVA